MVQKITEESVSGSNKRERAKVTVKTGAGDDVADVKVVNATAFDAVDQGVGQTPAYSFAFDLSATDVEIDLGDGADEVTVSGGMSARYGQKALQAALDYARDKLDLSLIHI